MIVKIMQAITLKAQGRRSHRPVIILEILRREAAPESNLFREAATALSRTLSRAARRAECLRTPRGLVRALFSSTAIKAVFIGFTLFMGYEVLTGLGTREAELAVGQAGLAASPWGLVAAIRAAREPMPEEPEEGGEA